MNELRKNRTCIDLNSEKWKSRVGGAGHVGNRIHIFATYGLGSLATGTNRYPSIQRRLHNSNVSACREIPSDVLGSNLSLQPTRGRNPPPGCPIRTISPSFLQFDFYQQHGPCLSNARLENPCLLRPNSRTSRTTAFYGRRLGPRYRKAGLRAGYNPNRFVPFAGSVGEVPSYESCRTLNCAQIEDAA